LATCPRDKKKVSFCVVVNFLDCKERTPFALIQRAHKKVRKLNRSKTSFQTEVKTEGDEYAVVISPKKITDRKADKIIDAASYVEFDADEDLVVPVKL